ncbi:uncharacterized protein ACMZJ9_009863 [Mantella aurantiaca]
MNMEKLRHSINNFSFDRCRKGNQGFNRILIQLFGLLGHGKSSFINTCLYVWQDGEYQNWAKANEQDGGSTTERIPYKLTSNIMVVDNRGLRVLNGYESGEIFAQLGNLLPLGKPVNWSRAFGLMDRIIQSEKSVNDSDFIVPVFVHSVTYIPYIDEITEMKSMLHTARNLTGIYPIVVLTHKHNGHLSAFRSIFREMGIERIFAFENYTYEDHFKTRERHEEVLKFLQEVIKDVQFRVEHQNRNPVREMQERKHFVMNYVHEREKRMEMEDLERKKALEEAMMMIQLQEQEEESEEEAQWRRQAEEEELRRRRKKLEKRQSNGRARRKAELRVQEEAKSKTRRKWLGLFCR